MLELKNIMPNPKGIIVSHTVVREGGNLSISGGIDSAILKKHLLYWDSISYPMVNGMGPNLEVLPELEYLSSQGILCVDKISIDPTGIILGYVDKNSGIPMQYIPDLLAHGQLHLAKDKLVKNEVWGVAQVGGALSFSSKNETSKNILELSLFEGLPVPTDHASFDDIINFRISHTNELNNLRTVLEKFREQVVSSTDPDRTLVLLKEELSDSIGNINNSMKKHKIENFFDTLSVYLNVSANQLTTTGLGVLLATGAGAPIALGASIGMGVNIILKAVEREVRGASIVPNEINDYMYLYTAQKHGIVS